MTAAVEQKICIKHLHWLQSVCRSVGVHSPSHIGCRACVAVWVSIHQATLAAERVSQCGCPFTKPHWLQSVCRSVGVHSPSHIGCRACVAGWVSQSVCRSVGVHSPSHIGCRACVAVWVSIHQATLAAERVSQCGCRYSPSHIGCRACVAVWVSQCGCRSVGVHSPSHIPTVCTDSCQQQAAAQQTCNTTTTCSSNVCNDSQQIITFWLTQTQTNLLRCT